MTHLKDFTASMERASKSDPMMQRWLYGTKELERQLSERLVHLCKYRSMIPEEVLASYTDVLLEALESAELEDTFYASSDDLVDNLIALAGTLEKSGDTQMEEKGRQIRAAVDK